MSGHKPRNLRENRTYSPPHPGQVPVPGLAGKLIHGEHRGWTTCYPAWCLQYYACLCSLKWSNYNVIVETGTNTGCGAALLAQTLQETKIKGHVHTFEIRDELADRAQDLFQELGLARHITIWRGNSLEQLPRLLAEHPRVDFAFIDSSHDKQHCIDEVLLLYDAVVAAEGKFYLDNTACGPVAEAIAFLKQAKGDRGWVEFLNCSTTPNGQVIWQPWYSPEAAPYFDPKKDETAGGR